MKTKKIGKLKQKIIISLVIVIMAFTWIMPTYSQAGFWSKIGGTLLDPVCDLLAAIGDVANNLVERTAGLKTNIFIDGSTSAGGGWAKIQNEYCGGASTRKDIQEYYGGTLKEKVIKVGNYNPDEAMEGGFDYILQSDIVCPNFKITPIEIFAGRVALLDANFFQEVDDDYKSRMIGAGEVGDDSDNGNSTVANLKETISTWYQAIRLIAIVGLLSVLVYVGLRMVTSAVATDKAKYKEMFVDWVIALCLVFFLHYIMVFTMTMVQEIQNLFIAGPATSTTNKKVNKTTINTILLYFDGYSLEDSSRADWSDTPVDSDSGNFDVPVTEPSKPTTQQETEIAIPTNLIGYNRVLVGNPDAAPKLTYTIMYLALTFYTIYFFFIYIKRVIILTFLTIIAPLVALTYPIDKVKDSKAQAFEFWLREYIVNAMIPIVHLILYTVLVTSALDLAVKSPLYAICVLAFIVPAEKIVKEMFGIKSSTTPALGGFAGGAMAAQMVQKLGKGKGKDKGKDGGSDKIRTKDDKNTTDPNLIEGDGLDALAGGSQIRDDYDPDQMVIEGFNNNNNNNQARANTNFHQAQGQQGQRSAQAQGQQPPISASPSQDGGTGQQSGNRGRTRFIDELKAQKREIQGRQGYKNFANMIGRKYNIPRGKFGRTVLKRAAKGIGKGYLRGAALIGGAAIGLAGGIVGGDMNDMWKGLAVGGLAGKQIGDNLSTGVENFAETAKQDYNEIKYGEDEANNMFADQEFINNVENREHVAAKIEEEHPEMERADVNKELEKRMQEYAKYRRAGVTDIKEMDRLHKIQESLMPTEEQRNNMSAEEQEQERANIEAQTLEIAKLSTRYSADIFRDSGKIEKATDALAQRFEKKGIESDRALALAADTMAKIRKIKGEA